MHINRKPCSSCPYRKDVPSGLWDASEYEKLPAFDRETAAQPYGVFMCHQADGALCRGWLDTHCNSDSAHELISLRLACATGQVSRDAVSQAIKEGPAVPVFESGAAAAAHGLRDVARPGRKAKQFIQKLSARKERDV